jgi:arginine repressor
VGTLAGDDTIFIATAGRTQQRSFVKRVKNLAT